MNSKDVPVPNLIQTIMNIISLSPSNLLQKIFAFLPLQDLFAVRLVCKTFKEAASDPQIFKLDLQEKCIQVKDLDAVVVQPLLKNITRLNQSFDYNYETAATITNFFKKIEDHCTNLHELMIWHGTIPKDVSLVKIGKRLSRLYLINLVFENASHFFETNPSDPVYGNLKELSLKYCTFTEHDPPFKAISTATMSNLRVLNLQCLTGFGDREYEHLKDSFANLIELDLYDMKVDGESFKRLNLSKMTKLNMYRCQVGNEWLSSLARMTSELEEFYLSDIDIGDTFSDDTFARLRKLKRIQMYLCTFGSQMMSAIGSQLIHLTYWQMEPNSFYTISDDALNGLEIQQDMEHIQFERFQFTGSSLRQIARCAPALKHLTLSNCSARDEDMKVFEDSFTRLVELSIVGMKITDSGLTKLEPRLHLLQKVTLESQFVTTTGLLWLSPFLTAAKCIDIRYGNEPKNWFHYNCICKEECQLTFSGAEITEKAVITLTKQFRNAKELCFVDLTLIANEMRSVFETQSDVTTLTFHNCIFDAQVTALVFRNLRSLDNFYVNQGQLAENAFLTLIDGIEGRSIKHIDIQNDTMPNDDTIRRILPMLTSVTVFNLRTYEHEQQMYVSKCESEFLFTGTTHVSDETVVTAMKLYGEMAYLALVDTAVTANGMSQIAPILDKVDFLRLRSKILGDETMVLIGSNFPSLKTLLMECDRVTDYGFAALDKHFESLEALCVIRSQITDEGIKKTVPLLKSVISLDLYRENVNVTKDLIKYMKETYPNVSHYEVSEPPQEHLVAPAEQLQDLELEGLQEANLEVVHNNLAIVAP